MCVRYTGTFHFHFDLNLPSRKYLESSQFEIRSIWVISSKTIELEAFKLFINSFTVILLQKTWNDF